MQTASNLKTDDHFSLSNRKNAKRYHAKIIEVVTGKKWSGVINGSGKIKENDIFIMGGECRMPSSFQMILKPNTEVYIHREMVTSASKEVPLDTIDDDGLPF